MPPLPEKIVRVPEIQVKTIEGFTKGEFRPPELSIEGVPQGSFAVPKETPVFLKPKETAIQFLEVTGQPSRAPSNVFLVDPYNPQAARGQALVGPVPKSVAVFLSAMGLGSFFLEPQMLSWLGAHLSSLLGFMGFPILGMVLGGEGKKISEEGTPVDPSTTASHERPIDGERTPQAIASTASVENLRDRLADRAEVQYSRIFGSHRVAFFGEVHHSSAAKREMAKAMEEMKKIGVTHLGMELPSSYQAVLDSYFRGNRGREDLEKLFGKIEKGSALDYGGDPIDQIKIVEAARAQGIRVVALDHVGVIDSFSREIRRRGVPTELILPLMVLMSNGGAPPFFQVLWSELILGRNREWAQAIGEVLEDPAAKMAVFGGKAHFIPDDLGIKTVNRILQEEYEIAGNVVDLVEGELHSTNFEGELTKAVRQERISGERFMLFGEEDSPLPNRDFILYLPPDVSFVWDTLRQGSQFAPP